APGCAGSTAATWKANTRRSTRARWRRTSMPTRKAAATSTPMMATTAADTATITDSASRNRPTRIAVERVNGRARIRTLDRGYFLTARPLQTSGSRIRIALIGVHMSLLGGDVIDLRIRADDGVTVELIEPVGLVAYNAEGRRADWRLSASLGTGAALIWHGCQFIAAQGSNAHRRVDLELDEQARALFMETLVLGRSGETDVQLRSRNHVTQTGSELLVEDLDLNPRTRHAPGLI